MRAALSARYRSSRPLVQLDELDGEQTVPFLVGEERCVVALRENTLVSEPVPSGVVGHGLYKNTLTFRILSFDEGGCEVSAG